MIIVFKKLTKRDKQNYVAHKTLSVFHKKLFQNLSLKRVTV